MDRPGRKDQPQGAGLAPRRTTRLAASGLLVALIAACGTRGTIAVAPDATASGATTMPIIVASSRAPASAPQYFTAERSDRTSFATFDVSVPPDRKPGTIRYPKGRPDPARDFLVTGAAALPDGEAFRRLIDSRSAGLAPGRRKGFVFVHGYNTNFAEALIKDAQLRYDLETPGLGVLYTWPSRAHLTAYLTDRESALFARENLAETLRLLSRTRLEGITVFAHSMGTFVTMESLLAMAQRGEQAALDRIEAVVLVSADLDIDVFRRQAGPVLAAGVPIHLVVSDDDKALAVSGFLRGDRKRLGRVRSPAELGGLDVSIVDVSDVREAGENSHLKIGTSPELIALFDNIEEAGVGIFEDRQKTGPLDQSVMVLQGATGLILRPLGE